MSDITYIWIQSGVCYLHLLTDVYSHAVLGAGLQSEYTIQALQQAISRGGGGNLCGTVHYSDRGSQYACDAYVSTLMEHQHEYRHEKASGRILWGETRKMFMEKITANTDPVENKQYLCATKN